MELTELFIRERKYFKNVSPATVSWYTHSFRAFSGAWESKAALGQRIEELLAAGISPISVNTYLRCIRAFLKWAQTEGHIQYIDNTHRLMILVDITVGGHHDTILLLVVGFDRKPDVGL